MTTAVTTANKGGAVTDPRQEAFSELNYLLRKMKQQLAVALPKHLTPERMIRVALTAWQRTPELHQCSALSIAGAVMQAAQLGLEIDSVLGHAYLVPRWNKKTGSKEATFQIGFRGMMELVSRSEKVSGMPEARCVYDGDLFDYEYGPRGFLRHKPLGEDDPAKITHAWAMAEFRDGRATFLVYSRRQIEKVRSCSNAAEKGPWVSHFPEMSVKTVLRALCKYLPMATEVQRQLAEEDLAAAGAINPADLVLPDHTAEEEPGQSNSDRLAKRLQNRKKPTQEQLEQINEAVNKLQFGGDEVNVLCGKLGIETPLDLTADQAAKLLAALQVEVDATEGK